MACASTGNTSASLAAYAAQAGIPALVLVPADGVALGKLAQSLAYGAKTLLVRGDFDACLRLVEEASSRLGVYLLNSINPFRIEGQKTIVLEMLQQLGWEPPDWIVLPAGNLGNTAAFGKALREAHAWGLISTPAAARRGAGGGRGAVRAELRGGFVTRHTVKAETVATAIRIGDPASYDRAVHAIRETDGVVLAVDGRRAPRGEGGGRRLRRRLRAGERRERRGRARSWCAEGTMRPEQHVGGGAHRPRAQGSRHPAPVPPRDGAAARRAPTGRSRSSRGSRRSSACWTEAS